MTKRRALMRCSPATTVDLVDEAGRRQNDAHAQAGEALDRIVGRDRRDDAVHMIVHRARVDLGVDAGDAERRRRAHGVRALARGEQRLGGNAAVVEAVAAHLVALDQHDLAPERGRGRRHRQAAGARADDADVGGDRLALGSRGASRRGCLRASCLHCVGSTSCR